MKPQIWKYRILMARVRYFLIVNEILRHSGTTKAQMSVLYSGQKNNSIQRCRLGYNLIIWIHFNSKAKPEDTFAALNINLFEPQLSRSEPQEFEGFPPKGAASLLMKKDVSDSLVTAMARGSCCARLPFDHSQGGRRNRVQTFCATSIVLKFF